MIHTDGIRTIANAGPVPVQRVDTGLRLTERGWEPVRKTASERIREARALREAALDAAVQPNRGPQANGQEWNDGYCGCGVAICDSPAGDKCWDCFNYDPSE